MTRLKLKVVPGASRDSLEGWLDDALKLKVRAAPEKGRANGAVENLLAAALGCRVRIVAGFGHSRKLAEVALEEAELGRRLAELGLTRASRGA